MSDYPPMKPREYEQARAHYGLTNVEFGRLFGFEWRHGVRYKAGETKIPLQLAKFIRTALRHKLSERQIG